MLTRKTRLELILFGLAGVKANAIYFLLYVLVTTAGVDPLWAVVAIFVFGALYSFTLNKLLVFRKPGFSARQLTRYLVIYSVVGFLNVSALHLATSRLGMNHIIAQGILVCVFALVLFVAQKYFIFSGANGPPMSDSSHNGRTQRGITL